MKESVEKYIQDISEKFKHEETSELGYRSDFESLLQKIFESIKIKRINHDAKAKEGNKPDFAVLSGDIPLVYIETKDIGVSLDKVEKSEQMSRYYGYANLVLTDYLEFRFYRNGLPYGEPVKVANYDIKSRSVNPINYNYELLAKTLLEFTQSYKEPIKSGKHLSKIMAGKAQRIRDNIRQFLSTELENKTELVKLYESIKKFLVHDLTVEAFADMYAQTLVYGLFIARFNDTTLDSFTRSEARDLIPNSNPFLHRFFDHIAGTDFDIRLKFIVDELCEVFSHSNIEALLEEFSNEDLWGKTHKKPDPVIYFYEDFLKEYDPVLRKKMGAYYTPEPVVQFIVRAVDDILKKDFNLIKGLGDTSKTKDGIHKVQILDPATGTGTFISAIIRCIYKSFKKNKQEGRWPSYVQNDLLPRLYGFEIMMTPYTIAHLKLSMAFKATGFKYFNSKRLGIYLTNALEGESAQQDMFSTVGLSESIAEESIEASKIKNEKPVMVVVGNPPYNVSSINKSDWIQDLIKAYKENLNERKINLDDDYIKFIRFAEHFIEKNKTGIVAMITNNSFIDGVTHRQMRKHLLETFDDIYVLNLHGDSKKKEKTNIGGVDENVFNIQQGVSISIFVSSKLEKNGLGNIYYSEIFGKRFEKFDVLNNNSIKDITWSRLKYSDPYYFYVPKDFSLEEKYKKGFSVNTLFSKGSSGIETLKDAFVINYDQRLLTQTLHDLQERNVNQYEHLVKSKSIDNCLNDKDLSTAFITKLFYRPFDYRYVIYSGNSGGILHRPRFEVMQHLLKPNFGLGLSRTVYGNFNWQDVIITNSVTEKGFMAMRMGNAAKVYPLYLYLQDGSRIPNLEIEILNKLKDIVGSITPENVLDYIYAILYSPLYRKKYEALLKIDFPFVPYPKNTEYFYNLVKFGEKLRELHLLESPRLNNFVTSYGIEGNDTVEKVEYKNGNVYINETQYFGEVPEVVWNFYVGGYQPAQRWLKDKKGKKLINEDIEHYQKIIVSLLETNNIMKEIDEVINI